MAPDPLVTISGRVKAATIPRLDRIAEVLNTRLPGSVLKRADALRAAVERGVEVLERELGIADAPPVKPSAKPSKASTSKGTRTPRKASK